MGTLVTMFNSQDFHGPDVFQVRVNTRKPELYGRVADVAPELEQSAPSYLEQARETYELTEGE
jgi:hypothetical protein